MTDMADPTATEADDPIEELHRTLRGMDDGERARDLARKALREIEEGGDWHWSDSFDTYEEYEAAIQEGEDAFARGDYSVWEGTEASMRAFHERHETDR